MKWIFLGDSIMQINGPDTYPQKGWPQALDDYVKPDIEIADLAKNGRSTKSFLDEGWFEKALEIAGPGDVALIGFGHNDEKPDEERHTEPYSSFQKNLVFMMDELKKKGVKEFILSTPVSRLIYDEKGQLLHTHGEYPDAIRDLAKKTNTPLLDLESLTYEDLCSRPKEENRRFYMCLEKGKYPSCPEGKEDTSHLQEEGAKWICSLAVPQLKKIQCLKGIFA